MSVEDATAVLASLAPFIKLLGLEDAAHIKAANKKLAAENAQLKNKLRRSITQRDEWRYQAHKYRDTVLEMKSK